MTFTPEQIAELQKPLDPRHVKKPSGQFGPKGDYLEGWHVINEANRIFGFDGWSYHIELTQNSLVEGQDSKGNAQWQAAYTCVCSVTVGDAFRQDVGLGSGFAKQVGDAIEGATKEAATDALKRALRTFGNQFGLALYDKERGNVCAPPPPTLDDEQVGALEMYLEASVLTVGQILKKASKIHGREFRDLRDLPASDFDGVKKAALDNPKVKEHA